MKAVILAAGEGKRLRPITFLRPKPMLPLLGKPLLEHTILGLQNAGVENIFLIVGYKQEIIKEYFEKRSHHLSVKIDYITQKEYLGTAHAASYAKDFIKDEETYKIVLKRRKHEKIERNRLIEQIAGILNNKVMLENPDKIIRIEILGNFSGISFIKQNGIIKVKN